MQDTINIRHEDHTWTAGDEDGYIERFAGVWHAWTSNDEGGGPAGHGETPEQAVEALLEQIAEQRDDWPEDFSRDR